MNKLGQPLSPGDSKPTFAGSVSRPAVSEWPVQNIEQQQYYEEETESKRPVNVWLIILLSLTIIALALFGIFEFYPSAFDRLNATYDKIIGKKEEIIVQAPKHDIKADASKKGTPLKDSTAKTGIALPSAIDTLKLLHFEVIAVHFKKWQKAKADAEVERFKSLGLDAKISADAPGPLLKISVGTYFTLNEADSARLAMINSRKISKFLATTLPINPQK
jgi:hypothetical protein